MSVEMPPAHFTPQPPAAHLPYHAHYPVRRDRRNYLPNEKNCQALFPPHACIFVGNLATRASPIQMADELAAMLSRFGPCYVKANTFQTKGRPLHSAFVQFQDIPIAEHVLSLGKNYFNLHGRYLRTETAAAKRTAIFGRRGGHPVNCEDVWSFVSRCGSLEHHEFGLGPYEGGRAFTTCTMKFAYVDDFKDALKAYRNDQEFYLTPVDNVVPTAPHPLVPPDISPMPVPVPGPFDGYYMPGGIVPQAPVPEFMQIPPQMPPHMTPQMSPQMSSQQPVQHPGQAPASEPANQGPRPVSSEAPAKTVARASTNGHAETPAPESPKKPARISAKAYQQRRHSCPPKPTTVPAGAEAIPRSTVGSPEPEPESDLDLSHPQVRVPVDQQGNRDSSPPVLAECEDKKPDVEAKKPVHAPERNNGTDTATPSPYTSRETSSKTTPITTPEVSEGESDEKKT